MGFQLLHLLLAHPKDHSSLLVPDLVPCALRFAALPYWLLVQRLPGTAMPKRLSLFVTSGLVDLCLPGLGSTLN